MNKDFLKSCIPALAIVVGAMSFQGCKDENNLGGIQPQAPAESVKTSFAFNLPYTGKTTQRMSSTNTQAEGNNFLGMYDIRLIPLTAEGDGNSADFSVIELTALGTGDLGTDNQHVYKDVPINVGTSHFLFYGVGGTAAPATAENKFALGTLTTTLAKTTTATAGITFNLEKVTNDHTGNGSATALLNVLNAVARVTDGNANGNGEIAWKDYTANTVLAGLYQNFITLKAGSADMVRRTLQDLYNAVIGMTNSTNVTDKAIATTIKNAIDAAFTAQQNDVTGLYTLTFQNANTYPEDCNLPQGMAELKFEGDAFSYDYDNASVGNAANTCFPASLYYFTNTDLWASDAAEPTWPTGVAAWAAYDWGANGWYSPVRASTHGIALANNIQYAVANLKVTVKCADVTELRTSEDDPDNAGQKINVTIPAAGFPVTGVIVGGQPTSVDWAFNSKNTAVEDQTQVVYDKAVPADMAAKQDAAVGTNYTLLLANKIEGAQQQASVQIAIELENNTGADFQGKNHGIIPDGAKFYLVATLNPTQANTNTLQDPAVFMQDYVTTANLTITSLENASLTIPDLRNTQMNLGISVDLDWQQGLVFDVDIN